MKTLLVLRHAKSSWKDASVSDHDRPLNKRGMRTAPRMGRLLADEDLVPDAVFCSTARRARDTAELVTAAAGFEGKIEYRDDLYHAAPDAYLAAAAAVKGDPDRVMVVGHNPGMEMLVRVLAGHAEAFPTAALAVIDLDIDEWTEAPEADGHLVNLWRPRELE